MGVIDQDDRIQYAYLDDSADWESYLRYRPAYPASIEKLILEHHRSHSNAFRLAHDIGSGSAVFAPVLAAHFQHVHVSDPQAQTLARARQRLSEFRREERCTASFSFSQTAAEEAHRCVARGGADLCALMMSAHWTDVDAMVDAVAESLAPRGTLAVCMYQPACWVVDNELVNRAVRALYAKWGELFAPTASHRIERNGSPLDFVPLRHEQGDRVFVQDVTERIKINFRARGDAAFAIPGLEDRVAASRVGPLQNVRWYNDEDSEGSGWRQEVDADWFRGSIATLEKPERFGFYEEHFQNIQQAIQETTENGKVVVEWAAALLLATRK